MVFMKLTPSLKQTGILPRKKYPLGLQLGSRKSRPMSGSVPRCATTRVQVGTVTVNGVTVPINRTQFGDVDGLPAPALDTFYIVSALVAQAVKGTRDDVLIVDDAVRDDQGRIIGARALART